MGQLAPWIGIDKLFSTFTTWSSLPLTPAPASTRITATYTVHAPLANPASVYSKHLYVSMYIVFVYMHPVCRATATATLFPKAHPRNSSTMRESAGRQSPIVSSASRSTAVPAASSINQGVLSTVCMYWGTPQLPTDAKGHMLANHTPAQSSEGSR